MSIHMPAEWTLSPELTRQWFANNVRHTPQFFSDLIQSPDIPVRPHIFFTTRPFKEAYVI